MIELQNISKSYRISEGKKIVLDNISYKFSPGENVGIIGLNGAGKSTLMRIICGIEKPDSGRVIRHGKVSFPIGFSGGFSNNLTGRENLRLTCRLYGEDIKKVTKFVDDFAELGLYMDMPIATYSSGMKAKLAFGLSMALNFDYYLVDEAHAVGDITFREKSVKLFEQRRKNSTLLVISHSPATIKQLCNKMLILYGGSLYEYQSLDEGFEIYNKMCVLLKGKTNG